jgi:DHA1 family tetracycline resistance protein-like MFS transporter
MHGIERFSHHVWRDKVIRCFGDHDRADYQGPLAQMNPIGSLALLRSHPELFRLATIQFIGYIAHEVFNVWALYTIFRYGWKEGTIGLSLALVGLCSVVISTGMVQPMVSRFGERRTLYIGQFFGALGMALAGLARTSGFFFFSIPVMMMWTISTPAAQGMMTRRVSESEQGELQGAISSLCSLAWIMGPGLFTFTFAYFIDQQKGWNFPAAPWYLGAFLLFVAMGLATRIPRLAPHSETIDPAPVVESLERDARSSL